MTLILKFESAFRNVKCHQRSSKQPLCPTDRLFQILAFIHYLQFIQKLLIVLKMLAIFLALKRPRDFPLGL